MKLKKEELKKRKIRAASVTLKILGQETQDTKGKRNGNADHQRLNSNRQMY